MNKGYSNLLTEVLAAIDIDYEDTADLDDRPIITVGDVDRTPDDTLARTPNFGGKSLRAMRAEIDRYLRRGRT